MCSGRDLELSTDVMLDKFLQKRAAFVRQRVVKAHAGTHKHLFYPRQGAQGAEDIHVFAVVGDKVFARRGEQALPALAGPVFQLALAGRLAEVGRGAADIVDIALKIAIAGKQPGLGQNRFLAAGGDDAALVKGEGAEVAGAKAAAHVGNGKFDLRKRGNAALRVVDGMPFALVGQGVHAVQFFAGKGHVGPVLQEVALAVFLAEGPPAHGVLFVVLRFEGAGVGGAVGGDFLHGGQHERPRGRLGNHHAGAGNAHIRDGTALLHPFCHAQDGAFAHAEHERVRARVHQAGIAHAVVPIVVVREATQRRLHPAQQYGHVPIRLPDAVGIDDGGAVGAHARPAAGGIHVAIAGLFGHGIVVDHRINHPGGDEEAQPRAAEARKSAQVRQSGCGNMATR